MPDAGLSFRAVERICPLLAMESDQRSVHAEPDYRHRCQATDPPSHLELDRQARLCLTDAHRDCERLLAYRQAHAWHATVPMPAADATFVSTRLVSLADRPGAAEHAPRPVRRLGAFVAAGIALAVLGVGVAGGAFSRLDLRLGIPSSRSPTPAAVVTSTPAVTPQPSPEPVPTPTPAPTATPTPTAVSSPGPTVSPLRTYVVEAGDNLWDIANLFDTDVEAIKAANHLTSDLIHPGQVLVIP